jgi:hypothetical protein
VTRIVRRDDDCQLLPEIKEFKKRSLQILASKGKKNPEIDKVTSLPDPNITKFPETNPCLPDLGGGYHVVPDKGGDQCYF